VSFTDEELGRFWNKVEKTPICWFWTGATRNRGYGDAWANGKHYAAHRLAYEAVVGPIPKGLTVDHKCGVTSCVNPSHLQVMTMLDNCLLGSKAQNTHCPKGHPFSEENTFWIKTSRSCRICKRARDVKYRLENPEEYRLYKRKQYARDKVKISAKQKEYYAKNKEKILTRQMEYQRRKSAGKGE